MRKLKGKQQSNGFGEDIMLPPNPYLMDSGMSPTVTGVSPQPLPLAPVTDQSLMYPVINPLMAFPQQPLLPGMMPGMLPPPPPGMLPGMMPQTSFPPVPQFNPWAAFMGKPVQEAMIDEVLAYVTNDDPDYVKYKSLMSGEYLKLFAVYEALHAETKDQTVELKYQNLKAQTNTRDLKIKSLQSQAVSYDSQTAELFILRARLRDVTASNNSRKMFGGTYPAGWAGLVVSDADVASAQADVDAATVRLAPLFDARAKISAEIQALVQDIPDTSIMNAIIAIIETHVGLFPSITMRTVARLISEYGKNLDDQITAMFEAVAEASKSYPKLFDSFYAYKADEIADPIRQSIITFSNWMNAWLNIVDEKEAYWNTKFGALVQAGDDITNFVQTMSPSGPYGPRVVESRIIHMGTDQEGRLISVQISNVDYNSCVLALEDQIAKVQAWAKEDSEKFQAQLKPQLETYQKEIDIRQKMYDDVQKEVQDDDFIANAVYLFKRRQNVEKAYGANWLQTITQDELNLFLYSYDINDGTLNELPFLEKKKRIEAFKKQFGDPDTMSPSAASGENKLAIEADKLRKKFEYRNRRYAALMDKLEMWLLEQSGLEEFDPSTMTIEEARTSYESAKQFLTIMTPHMPTLVDQFRTVHEKILNAEIPLDEDLIAFDGARKLISAYAVATHVGEKLQDKIEAYEASVGGLI